MTGGVPLYVVILLVQMCECVTQRVTGGEMRSSDRAAPSVV